MVVPGVLFDARDGDLQDQPRPTGIGDYEITSAAQNEERQISGLGECDRILHFGGRPSLHEKAGWTSQPERGQRRDGNIFLEQHGFIFTIHTACGASVAGSWKQPPSCNFVPRTPHEFRSWSTDCAHKSEVCKLQ